MADKWINVIKHDEYVVSEYERSEGALKGWNQ